VSRIIKHFYPQMQRDMPFYCAVMGSIAGLISSPMFAVYGATKAAVCKLVESLNIELEAAGTPNRILNISPGSIKGTKFSGGDNDLQQTAPLASDILDRTFQRDVLFIPEYEQVFKGVLARYQQDAHQFGLESYGYKQASGRIGGKPQVKVGYLSGTFDLFHIGHLNLMKRAKACCDYLVVGVHKDASHKGKETFISFEERVEIVKSIEYVDKVISAPPEDVDAYPEVKYDYLFVGSDYEGSERFKRYEAYFEDKAVEIIYFPYTKGTSSTQLRNRIDKE
jgi:glycerol-3-phosphate cytidylyltransferase